MPIPLAVVLALVSAAVAGPKRDEAPSEPMPLSEASCRSRDGLARVDFLQPEDSTFAAGPGECWLTIRQPASASPIRVYVSLGDPGASPVLFTPDPLDIALDWTRREKLFRGDVAAMGEGTLALPSGEVPYFRIQGRPTDGPALREAIVARVASDGHEIVLLAHYDAINRQNLDQKAVSVLESMSVRLGAAPAVAEQAAPKPRTVSHEREADRPPAALGRVPGESIREVPVE